MSEAWVRDYASGMALRQVAAKHGLSYSTLRRRFEAMGVTSRHPGVNLVTPEMERQVCDLYDAGGEVEVVAHQVGVSKASVYRILREDLTRLEGQTR